MRLDVNGDSLGSLQEYYQHKIIEIKEEIDNRRNEITNKDLEDLTEFFIQDSILPSIEIDTSKERSIEKDESVNAKHQMLINIYIPIRLEERIDQVIGRRSSTYIHGQNNFALENGILVVSVWVKENFQQSSQIIENEIVQINKVIEYKNQDAESINKKLKQEIKQYLEEIQTRLRKHNSVVDDISKKLNLKLLKKDSPIIDLEIKKPIKILMPPQKEKRVEPELEQKDVNTVIELIQKQCRQFEITPEAFSSMEEEWLRDVILGMLNAVFEGDATGESFVKKGKTDIRLKMNIEGGILSGECKFWGGQKLYQETIDQHFNYLTYSQNFAIQITFSKNKNFSEVLQNAKNASTNHDTYVKNSLQEIETQHFVTYHTFRDDEQKKIQVHHILVDLSTN